MKHGDCPYSYVSLPEGISKAAHCQWILLPVKTCTSYNGVIFGVVSTSQLRHHRKPLSQSLSCFICLQLSVFPKKIIGVWGRCENRFSIRSTKHRNLSFLLCRSQPARFLVRSVHLGRFSRLRDASLVESTIWSPVVSHSPL